MRRHLSPLEKLELLNMLQKLNFYVFLVIVILRYEILWLVFKSARPKLVALGSATLVYFTSTDDHGHVLLHDHLPEVVCGFWKGSLGSDDFLVTQLGV